MAETKKLITLKQMKTRIVMLLLLAGLTMTAMGREKLNFNADWRLCVGDVPEASKPDFDDSGWQRVTLPYAFNGDEAFRKDIVDLTDTICWYRKTFTTPLISPEGEEASPRGGLEGVGNVEPAYRVALALCYAF